MFHRKLVVAIGVVCLSTTAITGCTTAASIATASADAQQKPPVSTYASTKSSKEVFTAGLKAMTGFGTLMSSDREAGVIQGQKGNWIVSVNISESKPGSKVDISARYVPGKKMDFNSRTDLTNDYLNGLQKELNEQLSPL